MEGLGLIKNENDYTAYNTYFYAFLSYCFLSLLNWDKVYKLSKILQYHLALQNGSTFLQMWKVYFSLKKTKQINKTIDMILPWKKGWEKGFS